MKKCPSSIPSVRHLLICNVLLLAGSAISAHADNDIYNNTLKLRRGDERFGRYLYNPSTGILVLRLRLRIRDRSRYFVKRSQLNSPSATEIWRVFSDPDAANIEQICSEGPLLADLIDVEKFRIDHLFSAGERVAFRGVGQGNYAGGFTDIDRARMGHRISLSVAGLLRVRAGEVAHAQIAFDRLGLHRHLLGR